MAVEPAITGSVVNGAAQAPAPALQALYDRYTALNLLAREVRRSMDLPAKLRRRVFSTQIVARDRSQLSGPEVRSPGSL